VHGLRKTLRVQMRFGIHFWSAALYWRTRGMAPAGKSPP